MSTQPELTVSHTSTVTHDQIDELGHMNVRWYGANAVAATASLCERLGLGSPALHSTYTRHHHEQMEGNELEVRSAVLTACLGDMYRTYTCLCVHVFMCVVYTFVCHVHTHILVTHVHYSHLLKGRQGYTSVYVRVSICSHTHTCLYAHVFMCVVYTFVCPYAHTYTLVYILMC